MSYCLDSNFFIQAWQKYYSPEISTDFWDWLAKLARDKEIFIPEEVYEEIEVSKDKLYDWIKTIKDDIVLQMDEKTQTILIDIMTKPEAKSLVDTNKKSNAADVFVVAYAHRNNAIVVTNDNNLAKLCKACDVKCLRDYEFLKEKNLKMSVL
ncbi:MAG: DUF4411 family protein [Endomicrobium sp.]|jgi:rRNA-processing protein FCF1|nr:DUF4411 family protein [Endomicrobium sp.]